MCFQRFPHSDCRSLRLWAACPELSHDALARPVPGWPSSTNATTRSRSSTGSGLPILNAHIRPEDRESQITAHRNPESKTPQYAQTFKSDHSMRAVHPDSLPSSCIAKQQRGIDIDEQDPRCQCREIHRGQSFARRLWVYRVKPQLGVHEAECAPAARSSGPWWARCFQSV